MMADQSSQLARLPENLPAGAKAFQAAVDGMLTQDVWKEILDAQVKKAKEGDRGAAKFLLEYAGGVASIRGATFVQETHNHEHFHDAPGPNLTNGEIHVPAAGRLVDRQDPPTRTTGDFEAARERRARQVANQVNGE